MMFNFRLCLLSQPLEYLISAGLHRKFVLGSRSISQLPVIDASNLKQCKTTKTQIATACNKIGAFYLKHHKIDSRRLLNELEGFFGNSEDAMKVKSKPKEGMFGYFSVGEEMTSGIKDWKEGVYYRAEYADYDKKKDSMLYANNYWPDSKDFPNFKHTVLNYLSDIKNLGFQLTTCIADDLGLKTTFFTDKLTDKPFQHIGMFRYPKCSEDYSLSSPFAVGMHSDPGFLAVILQDAIGGLEIKSKTGQWMTVPPIADTLVVLMCDLAEVWTSGYCHSVIHRVQKPFEGDRYSVVVFVDPSLDCTVVPGEAKGNSNCEVAPRLTQLARRPFKFHDYCVKYYETILSKNAPA